MPADALTKDLIPVPSQWRLSMELLPDRLEVVLNSALEDHALMHRQIPLAEGISQLAAFEDIIYENPLLLADFKKVDLLVDTPRYTFLPGTGYEPVDVTDALKALWPSPELAAVANPLPLAGDTLIMALDQGLLSFVRRTFLDTVPQHPLAALITHFTPLSQQGNSGKAYVNLRNGAIDIIILDHKRRSAASSQADSPLRMASSYDTPSPSDALYFIIAAFTTAGLSLQHDEILLCGDQAMREELMPKLRQLAKYVMPVIFPSEIFRSGREAIDAPFPLVILPLNS